MFTSNRQLKQAATTRLAELGFHCDGQQLLALLYRVKTDKVFAEIVHKLIPTIERVGDEPKDNEGTGE